MLPADNPQQSEESSHMGGGANLKDRKSKKGGPRVVTESDVGYHSLFEVSFLISRSSRHYLSTKQIGDARTAKETREELETQINLAMLGVEKAVTDRQTYSGTKDPIAQNWIDILIAKARELKATQPHLTKIEIAADLREWFDAQPGDKINPLLSVAGKYAAMLISLNLRLLFRQDLIQHKTRLLRYYILFCLESSNTCGTIYTPRGLRQIVTFLLCGWKPQISTDSVYLQFELLI